MNGLHRCITIATLVAGFALPSPGYSQGDRLYRYKDDRGVLVISSQIPARYVSRGYEVISRAGRVLQVIAPELSPEKKALLAKELIEKERLAKWDTDLLRRYSHPDDIEDAKGRKLAQNRNNLNIIKRNIEKTEDEINHYQSLAAAEEREGREVSADTLASIEQLKRKRTAEIKTREAILKEREAIVDKFNKDINRFKIIRPDTASRPVTTNAQSN